ncbi:hypothetical protein CC1G_01826 [Coprinopsis cinerea okayama7|uniref:Uncharacterized protein n=1 Tax=Coprinopsis cinerea (strain Okayama-7 / 130 / ATCC MYA-4618 / FGSC 9003) TaxID=240176 RepID=A8N2S4_COPC7|nr:hypothetical protein CC1G_01826 [Coprinopsis cinerea okayama7\|eukprot:XP_001829146.2 hypothetical protein CC1G_01826 [Coprinopsis cinerea okayama7\
MSNMKATSQPGNVVPSEYIQAHNTQASHDTTAARAQAEAQNISEAANISQNASREQHAAQEAARHAQELGTKLTGNPEGDADSAGIKKSLNTTSVSIGQNYSSQQKDRSQAVSGDQQSENTGILGSIQSTASAALNMPGEMLQGIKNTVTSTVETAEGYLGMGTKPGEPPVKAPAESGIPSTGSGGPERTSARN